ncbi:Uncharacterised protein [Staphylococcus aureus]|nr:Uncharacterised protein [Staphylococcus aureus]
MFPENIDAVIKVTIKKDEAGELPRKPQKIEITPNAKSVNISVE